MRRYLRDGEQSNQIEVEHFTSRKYAAFHRLRVEVSESMTTIEVVLFGWLVYEVRFHSIVYRGPDFVYVEDLARRCGMLADSWKEAMEGQFYSTRPLGR